MELTALRECGLEMSELALGKHDPTELVECWRATLSRDATLRMGLRCAALRDAARGTDPDSVSRVPDLWRAGLAFEPDSPSWLQVWSPDLDLRRIERELCERVPRTRLAALKWDALGERLISAASHETPKLSSFGQLADLLRVARAECAARFAGAPVAESLGATRDLAARMCRIEALALQKLEQRASGSSIDPDTVCKAFAETGHLLLSRSLKETKVAECHYTHPLHGARHVIQLFGRTQNELLETLDLATALSWRSLLLPASAGCFLTDDLVAAAIRTTLQ